MFFFEILRGKLARGRRWNGSPRACLTFDRCVVGARVRSSGLSLVGEISFNNERNQMPIQYFSSFNCSVLLVHIFIYFSETYSDANLRETFSLFMFLHEESNCIDRFQQGK